MTHSSRRRAAPLYIGVVAAGLGISLILGACGGLDYKPAAAKTSQNYPDAAFAVVSDVHFFSNDLGTSGAALEDYLKNDRKMLVQSEELFDIAIERVKASGAKFLLISGDLTKDGEELDHVKVAAKLKALADAGIRSYVVPGNHDVLNPHANKYEGDVKTRVPYVSPERFAEIYAEDGYGDALARDPASLSYIAEPVPGLLLFALDSCRYDDKPKSEPVTGGAFKQPTIDWIRTQLAAAAASGKAVMVMMHHGVVEHFLDQAEFFKDYVVSGWRGFSDMLAKSGVRLAFTGHYHAQDIVEKKIGSDFILDIETGSLVSYPSPVRTVTISGGGLSVRSQTIDDMPSFQAAGKSLKDFSLKTTRDGVTIIAIDTMIGLGISRAEAESLANPIADAFAAHYAGDERFTGKDVLPTQNLSFMGGIVISSKKPMVVNLWNDTAPADRDLDVLLGTGVATDMTVKQ